MPSIDLSDDITRMAELHELARWLIHSYVSPGGVCPVEGCDFSPPKGLTWAAAVKMFKKHWESHTDEELTLFYLGIK